MEAVVPTEITAELTQILSNLVLGDNQIRANAEKAVNDRLAHSPELYLLALAQFAIMADTPVMRSFSLVLLRRLLFRSNPSLADQQRPTHAPDPSPRITLYDRLSSQTLTTLERLLLHSLSHEPLRSVRLKTVDSICDLANSTMSRGIPWHALQAQAFSMTGAGEATSREAAYRVFTGCPNLVMDLQTESVLSVYEKGLSDSISIDVRHAALRASVAYLIACDAPQLQQSQPLMYPILSTLPAIQNPTPGSPPSTLGNLASFILSLTPLCTSGSATPLLFAPHLQALLTFLPALILPSADCGPTPTALKPFPSSGGDGEGGGGAFTFPPPSSTNGTSKVKETEEEEAKDKLTLRRAALEFMISLSEAKPSMVQKVDGWAAAIVRGCLEGMGEFEDTLESLEVWLDADPSDSSNGGDDDDDEVGGYPHTYEQALDRLACALGGKYILGPAFQYIPSMLKSYDWRVRHAGLMAIASIAEGTSEGMEKELGKVVDLVTPMFSDSHPRVRYAACQCVGQLCTDLEEVIQEKYHAQLFGVLIPTLEAPEPRVHSHAAAALINFCEGVEQKTLVPYMDPIVERLLKLLNPGEGVPVKHYVQEQAITTLAMVADASETTFAKHYPSIMPLLLNVLRNAEGPDYRKLRVKAMECAGLIAIAVGREVFRPDSATLVELLMRIQNSPVDPGDTLLGYYLIATWAKVCQALGPEFEPYLPIVMPPLLAAAALKADISLYDEDEDRDGWDTLVVDGRSVGIKTSAIEEKCQAFETLVIYCSTLGARFAPYLAQTLELTLPCFRFVFHEGVREAAAMLTPMLLSCGKESGTLTIQMVTATFQQLAQCITLETDPTFLGSLYKCFTDSMFVIDGPANLPPDILNVVIEGTKRQLHTLADKRKARAARSFHMTASGTLGGINPELEERDEEDIALLEEIEDFGLEDMSRLLTSLDPAHPLLIAVAGVRELAVAAKWDSDEGDS